VCKARTRSARHGDEVLEAARCGRPHLVNDAEHRVTSLLAITRSAMKS
jgi:hypothetical protein